MMAQDKQILIIGLGVITIWDAFTTITGTAKVLGGTGMAFFLSVVFAVMLTTFLIKTIPIMYHPKTDLLHTGAKILWGLAMLYDIFTSFVGNKNLIESGDSSFGLAQVVVTIGMTIFVSSSPIAISYLLYVADE